MKISVTCAGCGKRHEVDAAHAGKRGKCTKCGSPMLVPAAPAPILPSLADEDEGGIYGIDEPTSPPPRSPRFDPAPFDNAASTFTRTGGGAAAHARSTGTKRRREEQGEGPGLDWRKLAIGIVVAALALFVLAAAVPGGTRLAGIALISVGLILSLVGYAMGAYGAFSEDLLYGFLYLFFPLYNTYYLVTRFDDLWRWLALSVVGLVLLSLGGLLIGFPPSP